MMFPRRPERRHSMRVSLQMPLIVESTTSWGEFVAYKALTLNLSANGALLALDARVYPGESLLLVNRTTSEAVQCYVTFVRDKRDGKGPAQRLVGVGFAVPQSNFWHIVFPRAGTRQATRAPRTGGLVADSQ